MDREVQILDPTGLPMRDGAPDTHPNVLAARSFARARRSGGRAQNFVRQRPLELGLAAVITATSANYLVQYIIVVAHQYRWRLFFNMSIVYPPNYQ